MSWLKLLPYIDELFTVLKEAGDAIAQAMRRDSEKGKRISKAEWQKIVTKASSALTLVLHLIAEGLGAEIVD